MRTRCPRRGIVLLLLGCGACDVGSLPSRSELSVLVSDENSAYPTLRLSMSLNEVAEGLTRSDQLTPDLVLAGELVDVFDVTGLADGGFAVADRGAFQVVRFDGEGAEVHRFGRRGDGPGDFRGPVGIAEADGHLLVWDADSNKRFSVFSEAGELVEVARDLIDGDWQQLEFRRPYAWEHRPYQWGWEETTRRLQVLGGYPILQVQPSEILAKERGLVDSLWVPDAHLVRLDIGLTVLDTLSAVGGVPLASVGSGADGFPVFRNVLYDALPVWTAGDGWLAIGHGDSDHLTITRSSGDVTAVVEWPHDREAVDRALQDRYAEWLVSERFLKRGNDEERERMSGLSSRERRRGREWNRNNNSWGDSVPRITQAFGDGGCLWIAGFNVEHYRDGASTILVGLDLEHRRLLGVVSLPESPSRVLDIRYGLLYATYYDDNALQHLARYRLPGLCGRAETGS
jgi:hypothetical protein